MFFARFTREWSVFEQSQSSLFDRSTLDVVLALSVSISLLSLSISHCLSIYLSIYSYCYITNQSRTRKRYYFTVFVCIGSLVAKVQPATSRSFQARNSRG